MGFGSRERLAMTEEEFQDIWDLIESLEERVERGEVENLLPDIRKLKTLVSAHDPKGSDSQIGRIRWPRTAARAETYAGVLLSRYMLRLIFFIRLTKSFM